MLDSILLRFKNNIHSRGLRSTLIKAILYLFERALPYFDPFRLLRLIDYHLNPRAIRVDKSGKNGDMPFDPIRVIEELQNNGLNVEERNIPVSDFHKWLEEADYPHDYRALYGEAFTKKALEHYVSLELLKPSGDSVIVDVASAGSPFCDIAVKTYGSRLYSNDIVFPNGIRKVSDKISEVGGNAVSMPLGSGTVTGMVLHCALEMFEGDNDISLVREASRLLKPGGRLVIIPIYLHEFYHILSDPFKSPRGARFDPRAEIVYRRNFVRHARFYDTEALLRRLIPPADSMKFKILYYPNAIEVDPSCRSFHFVGIFDKLSDN